LTRSERGGDAAGGESAVEALLRIASNARTIRSADGGFHAHTPVGDEISGPKSSAFRDWLVESYHADRGEIPSANAVGRVLTALEAHARFDVGMTSVHVRVGRDSQANDRKCLALEKHRSKAHPHIPCAWDGGGRLSLLFTTGMFSTLVAAGATR
jgi:hypothetical protein